MVEKPKRKLRWKRWMLGLLAAAILCLLGLHQLWGIVARRELHRRIAELQARGEPITVDAFTVATSDDANINGAVDIEAALGLVPPVSKAREAFEQLDEIGLPLRDDELRAMSAATGEASAAMERLAQARGKAVQRPVNLTSSLINDKPERLSAIRHLINALWASALLDHSNGDDARAMARLADIGTLCRYTQQDPRLLSHLVAVHGFNAMSLRAGHIAAELRVGSDRAATPQALREMIDALLDDQPWREGLRRALQCERVIAVDALRELDTGQVVTASLVLNPEGRLRRFLLRPLYSRNGIILIDRTAALLPLAEAKNLPALRSNWPLKSEQGSRLDIFADILTPSHRVFDVHFRGATDRRLAAAALAIRWYATEHEGRRPERLDDLVPKYLPYVPADPLARDDMPLNYLPQADPPIIYSVGRDGIDDAGSEAVLTALELSKLRASEPGKHGRRERDEPMDHVVHLNRRPRPEKPVTDFPSEEQFEDPPETADEPPAAGQPRLQGD